MTPERTARLVARWARLYTASWRRRARPQKGSPAIPAIAIAVAAILYGQTDDAPGLVLLGLLLVAATVALGVRTVQRGG